MTARNVNKHATHGWGGEELVMCVNGPREGAWYTLAFWQACMKSAIAGGETPHTGRTLGYVRTNEKEPHRLNPGVTGHILAWAPDVAAAAMERAS